MTVILDHISKSYNGREVLKDFYLEVEDKRIYQIVGPEGSGKRTIRCGNLNMAISAAYVWLYYKELSPLLKKQV